MSKVTRPKLTRGTKLKTAHVHGVLGDIATDLNASNVTIDQLSDSMGTFRINFHIPCIDSRFASVVQRVDGSIAGLQQYAIPFTLPPAQNYFKKTGVVGDPPRFKVDRGVPRIILDEFSFSFDQGAANAARPDYHDITTSYGAGTNEGTLDYEEIDAYTMELSLSEKDQWFFTAASAVDGTASKRHPKRTIFTYPINGAVFASKVNKPNPFVITDINHVMRPFTTYIIYLSLPNLTKVGVQSASMPNSPYTSTPDRSHALYSVQISLKCRTDLDRRDEYSAASNSIRNYPSKDSATTDSIRSRTVTGDTISISTPLSNTDIEAETAGGINTNIQFVDQAFRDKFRGGFNDRSETAATQELYADSCYEVLTIPLLNNAQDQVYGVKNADLNGSYAGVLPSGGGGAYESIADRRIIPLKEPMIVHHIILARSFMDPATYAAHGAPTHTEKYPALDPNANGIFANIQTELGVGIGSGLRGDLGAYINLAYVNTAVGAAPQFTVIDYINSIGNYTSSAYTHDLLHVPLMSLATGSTGLGYGSNGLPIYMGKSWDPTSGRTNAINTAGALATPATKGQEQFLEVRIRLSNSAGAVQDATSSKLYVGYGGLWLYVIGKKYLTRGYHGDATT